MARRAGAAIAAALCAPAALAQLSSQAQGQCAPDNSAAAGYLPLAGSLHEHSGYSDGTVGTIPADYFAQGAALGLDFMGASEHSDNALLPVTANADCLSPDFAACLTPLPSTESPAAPAAKWQLTLDQARAATTADFTAFRGFEWTSDRFGHINVFFSRNDWNAKSTEGYTLSMESFWVWLATPPELGGGGDGLGVFNHPGREDQLESSLPNGDPAYAFDDFAYRPDADQRMVGIETFGKGGDAYDADHNAPAGGWYAYALDKGWHLGPVGAEDEHGTNWARPERAKTVLVARDRSETALREALLARRFYALAQHHNDLRLSFAADGEPMGARLARSPGARVTLQGRVTAGAGAHRLEVVTAGGAVLRAQHGRVVSAVVAAQPQERWYYLRVLDAAGAPIAYSAPVWIRAGGEYPVCADAHAGG